MVVLLKSTACLLFGLYMPHWQGAQSLDDDVEVLEKERCWNEPPDLEACWAFGERLRLQKIAAGAGEDALVRAAKAGHTKSQASLGILYADGSPGVTANGAEALRLLSLASENGDGKASYHLGVLHALGRVPSGEKDLDAAQKAFVLATEQGEVMAWSNLGALLVGKDNVKAEALFKQGAELGDVDALYNLGVMHWPKPMENISMDVQVARVSFLSAASKNSSKAQYALGLLLLNDEPPDNEEAANWLDRAASQGHDAARRKLQSLLDAAKAQGLEPVWEEQVEEGAAESEATQASGGAIGGEGHDEL